MTEKYFFAVVQPVAKSKKKTRTNLIYSENKVCARIILKTIFSVAGKVAKVGATPGVTRAIQTKIRVHDDPLVYLVNAVIDHFSYFLCSRVLWAYKYFIERIQISFYIIQIRTHFNPPCK